MQIQIQEKCLDFDNDPKIIKEILNEIVDFLDQRSLKFSYLMIDKIPVYEEFYQYFTEHISTIETVEVVFETVADLVNETVFSAHVYIKNALPLIMGLAEAFYKQADEKTWMQLNDLLEGIQWIIDSLKRIDTIKNLNEIVNNYEIWNEYVQTVTQLIEIIPELEDAIQEKDMVLIGDLLLYEMISLFEKMLNKLQFLLPIVVEGVNVS